jgi:hypothetical protein
MKAVIAGSTLDLASPHARITIRFFVDDRAAQPSSSKYPTTAREHLLVVLKDYQS